MAGPELARFLRTDPTLGSADSAIPGVALRVLLAISRSTDWHAIGRRPTCVGDPRIDSANVVALRAEPRPPKLLDRVRQTIRAKHYSRRTEVAYVDWIRRFILFHRKRHPSAMGAKEISSFIEWLAVERRIA